MSKETKSKVNIPPVAIIDNIVFSRDEVWAYYKINTVPFEFLDGATQARLGLSTNVALAALMRSSGKPVDCHVLVTSTPFSVDSWEEQMYESYKRWNPNVRTSEEFMQYITNQSELLRENHYQKRVTYLGIKLYTRGAFSLDNFNVLEFGFKDAYEVLKKSIGQLLAEKTVEVMPQEESRAKSEEHEIQKILKSGALRAETVSSEELLLLIKKQLHPAMPAPLLDINLDERAGLNDINRETISAIEHGHRYVKVNQVVEGIEMEGYRATMSFASFPRTDMGLPSAIPPFLYYPTMIGAPYTMNSRFSLIPPEKAKKDLANKKLETDDELENLALTGGRLNASINATLQDIALMESELEESMPWVSGSYRLTIEMPTMDMLTTAATEIKQMYAEFDISLVWTSGDQLDLMFEEIPGGKLMIGSFNQMTNLAQVGTSGFNFGGIAGDPVNEERVMSKKGGRK